MKLSLIIYEKLLHSGLKKNIYCFVVLLYCDAEY